MTREPVHAHPEVSNLFRGAPAVAYALHHAGQPSYQTGLATLDAAIRTLVAQRLDAALQRIDAARLARASEYDLINGLTGLGAYLIHRHHDHPLLREILAYLVRLTRPIRVDTRTLPGWWATGSPDRRQSPRWHGGHTGFGMAHGIAGPLALLSVTMRRGIIVLGHQDAIHTICAWLDQWRTGPDRNPWWPDVIGRDDLAARTTAHGAPHRPSWCYGTPGIARAQHLAAIATNDWQLAELAEHALIGCLTDDRQLAQITDPGLCHGWAGLVHTARCAAADTGSRDLANAAETAASRMCDYLRRHSAPTDDGLLAGATGVALIDAAVASTRPRWDTCLLVS
ncbi:lanthionine synthetase C family protein [Phytohabitans sp. LJ34]|uniref:lanthionine synthetase C family protein n=1 Tax=Phytohabitans sp. LJ34 TaxID=3452217 RepID=UPI003F8A41EA